jgi:very-short-patch-repair endonuclease
VDLQRSTLELLGRQYGVASIGQLLDAGMSRRTVLRAVQAEVLTKLTRTTYLLTSHALTFEAKAMAAWLHCGPQAFVCGPTAGRLHGLRYMPKATTFVTALHRVPVAAPPWIKASRTTWMIAGDYVRHPSGMLVAHPLRNLHQLAGMFNRFRFERAAESAWHLELVTPDEARDYLQRMRRQGRTGVSMLESWFTDVAGRMRPTQSGLETDALEAFRRAGLPKPARQHPLTLLNGEVIHIDVAWPDVRLGVEPGHSWWHGGDLRQRADQERDRACGEVGWQICRFDESMREDLYGAGQQIRRIYQQRRMFFRTA